MMHSVLVFCARRKILVPSSYHQQLTGSIDSHAGDLSFAKEDAIKGVACPSYCTNSRGYHHEVLCI